MYTKGILKILVASDCPAVGNLADMVKLAYQTGHTVFCFNGVVWVKPDGVTDTGDRVETPNRGLSSWYRTSLEISDFQDDD